MSVVLNSELKNSELKKLIYRASYRGTLESDLLMRQIMSNFIYKLQKEEYNEFNKILQYTDKDLVNWIALQKDIPPQYKCDLLIKLQKFYAANFL